MLEQAMKCPWCKADLKGKEIPIMSQKNYNATHFTKAIELYNIGYEHEECDCQWDYNGKILKDGIKEFKDKYKVKENKEIGVSKEDNIKKDTKQPDPNENINTENNTSTKADKPTENNEGSEIKKDVV